MQGIAIIGVGRIGGALAIALSRAGFRIDHLIVRDNKIAENIRKNFIPNADIQFSKDLSNIRSNIILIATDDPEIERISGNLSEVVAKGQYVFHTSGSLTSSVLEVLRSRGCGTGSIHPLVSVSDPIRGSGQFKDAYFCLEGTEKALRTARRLVKELGGNPFSIPTDRKELYHAAAVTSAGHVTALFDIAVEMLVKCGVETAMASKILLPLVTSTVSNLSEQSIEKALTGSFARLDLDAFERHIAAFDNDLDPVITSVYLSLGSRSVDIVERANGPTDRSAALRDRISMAKENFK